jgi:methionyl-tRNA synthetase
MSEKIVVSVAWPYCNGDLHIGHLAGAYLPADIFARYQRMCGNDVIMVSGSDTHGTPITVRAEQEGLTPREVVDRYHPRFLDAFVKLGISFDLFTETDTENHWAVTQDMFLRLLDKGYIYKDTMRALYCEHCQRYLADRYVEGTCPHCHYEEARGDQCDECGHTLDAIELISPRCKFCGRMPVVRETEHFFLDLGRLAEPLAEWADEQKNHWRPNVYNFTINMLREGNLRGRPITRDILWGVPIPIEGYEDKCIYVWFDAVIGYLSASIEWAKNNNQPDAWETWWKQPSRGYYFVGKDNIPFHTVIWPGMLWGYGGLNLPYDVPANEYLNVEGRQLSKSRRWVIEVLDYLERYDPDPLRYMLSVNAPEGRDVNFTWDEFVRRNNDELVATWGNLVNRMLTFTYKNFDQQVPQPGELDQADQELISRVEAAFGPIGELLNGCNFKMAIREVMILAHEANRYLNEKAPWFQIKEDRQVAATSIYVVLRVIDSLKTLFYPFMPASSSELHQMLGYETDLSGRQHIESFEEEHKSHLALCYDGTGIEESWKPSELPAGQKLLKPKTLFKKLDTSVVDDEVRRMIGE